MQQVEVKDNAKTSYNAQDSSSPTQKNSLAQNVISAKVLDY